MTAFIKYIISITILIFAFCFAAFAQTEENQCPKIDIEYPDTVTQGDLITFLALVDGKVNNQVPIDWQITADDKIVDKSSDIIVGANFSTQLLVDTTNISKLRVRASLLSGGCNEKVIEVKIKILQVTGCFFSSKYEYQKEISEDVKALFDTYSIAAMSQANVSVVVALGVTEFTDEKVIKIHIQNLTKYLMQERSLGKSQIRFMLFWTNKETAEILVLPNDKIDFPSSVFEREKQLTEKELENFLPEKLTK